MVRKFADESNRYARSLQVWLILTGMAMKRETKTYGQIGRLIGAPRVAVDNYLDPIFHFCENNGLPRLAVSAVSERTGQPGNNYPGPRESLDGDREAVYRHYWFSTFPPTLEELEGGATG